MPSSSNLSLWENFIEAIAQVLSRALSDKETEDLVGSVRKLQQRLRELSEDNLKRLQDGKTKRFCKHKGSCFENCSLGFARSFLITYAVKYLLGFVPSLITGKVFQKPELLYKLGGKDTRSFALFMASFISTYKGVLCFLRYLRRKNSSLNSFIAGALSGFTILFDRNESRRVMIALYLSTRTLHFVGRYLYRHYLGYYVDDNHSSGHLTPTTPERQKRFFSFSRRPSSPITPSRTLSPTTQRPALPLVAGVNDSPNVSSEIHLAPNPTLSYLDDEIKNHHHNRKWLRQTIGTVVMALSSSQILYAYVCEPDTLNRSYLSFLLVHGGIKALQPKRTRQYLDIFGATIHASAISPSSKFVPNTNNFRDSIPPGLPVNGLEAFKAVLTETPHEYVMCAIQHPATSFCTVEMVKAFLAEWNRAFSLYAPLNVVMMIIFKGQKLLKSPLKSLQSMSISILRSTLFLSCYVTAAWSLPCLFRNTFGRDKVWMYYLNGICAGSMVLIEQPGRRLELGMYCLPRAVESLWNSFVAHGRCKNIKNGEAIYFSFACGIMMSLYQYEPGSIHKTYRDILHRLFGIN